LKIGQSQVQGSLKGTSTFRDALKIRRLNKRTAKTDSNTPMSRNGNPVTRRVTDPAASPPSKPAREERALRILQITDLHLYSGPEGRLLGQNTRETFELVLNKAVATHWPADRLLLTGDLVHDESPEGYRYLAQRIAELDIPCNGLPGNHDAPQLMSKILDDCGVSTVPSVRCGSWNLVFLDSTIPENEGGHLHQGQLDQLDSSLAAHPDAHALIFLHHQPVPVGSRWMDTMALDNPDDFFAILDRNPQVRGVVWGHVHQEFTGARNGIALLGTPSTCVQFLPGSDDFAVDALPPGYHWLHLHPDGRIETGIERIAEYPAPMDLSTGGY
jgi:Icc protein